MQKTWINQSRFGRVKTAKGTLFVQKVDSSFDSDGSVDLTDEGCGHSKRGNTTADPRGGHGDQVGTDTSSQGYQNGFSIQIMVIGLRADAFDLRQSLGVFGAVQHKHGQVKTLVL